MSQNVYSGPFTNADRPRSSWRRFIPWVFVVATIGGHIAWILSPDDFRPYLTIGTVVTFFLASATHAYLTRGAAWTGVFLLISLAYGWLIEVLGTRTQFPFGDYTYSDALGIDVLGVPLVIPLAWSMMAYPILLAVQSLFKTGLGVAVVGGWLLMAWDLFLDPQMVSQGYWVWNVSDWEIPGISGIPLQNFLGWWLAGIGLMFLLDRLPRIPAQDAVPNTLLIWTFASNVLAAAVFFNQPSVALWGGVAMGIVVFPWMWRLWSKA